MKKIFVFALFCFFALGCMIASAKEIPMRGVWVSTVYNLDFPNAQTTDSEALKKEIDDIVKNCSDMGFNAIFFQVRPSGDAFYSSKIFPWSRYLTGIQGLCPDDGFDPLEYWIDKCHEHSIELHAWINPYRITKDKDKEFASLSADNPAVLNPDWVVKYTDGNYYYNPAVPEVRNLVADGVKELLDYDIDGIHMDDYFYPGTDFDDAIEYEKYNNNEFSNIDDWRRNNVNLLVEAIHKAVEESGKDVSFGISPFGIWANKSQNELGSETNGKSAYYDMCADSLKWVRDKMVDYLAPQLYWEFGYSPADYKVLFYWWKEAFKDSNVKLYIGLGDYRADGAPETSAWYKGEEIKRQMDYNYKSEFVDGEIHFRYKFINQIPELKEIITQRYKNTVMVFVEDKRVIFDTYPLIVNDRTMVPLRAVFEALGATVSWEDETKTVTAGFGNDVISLTIGMDFMNLNEEKIKLDSVAFIENDRTYVPLRAISEAFKYDVSWDGDNKTVTIKKQV